MATKIVALELENVKRVSLVNLEFSPNGLTVIGGKNGQGKTSILDAICYALGGERYRPGNLQRDGGIADARIKLTLSNGLTVERTGKNAALKVTDTEGNKTGQRLLDSFIEELAINLPKFLQATNKEKAQSLLKTLGIGDQLEVIEKEERVLCQDREAFYKVMDQKEKFYRALPWYDDVPDTPLTANDLVKESQEIMRRNGERENLRRNIEKAKANAAAKQQRMEELSAMFAKAEREYHEAKAELAKAEGLPITPDESTAEIEEKLAELEDINAKVRANLDKEKAKDDAGQARAIYNEMSDKIKAIRERRMALLEGAKMPLPGLSVEDGELTMNGKKWDCMSSSEQLRAAVAIVKSVKPECGFVLIDKLEQLDLDTLNEFGAWLEAENLQAIATRVSTGEECSIIIEDGRIAENNQPKTNPGENEFVPAF